MCECECVCVDVDVRATVGVGVQACVSVCVQSSFTYANCPTGSEAKQPGEGEKSFLSWD